MATQRELLDAYNRLSSRIVRGSGLRLASVFSNLGSWRDSDFERFFELANTTLTGASMQAAKLQVAFYKQMAELQGEKFIAPQIKPSDFTTEALRNGAQSAEVYRRPFVNLYTALANGKPMTEAIQIGANRISSIASTDVQLARRNAGFGSRSRNDRIVGYARTLTGAENCALCTIASTQRYTRDKLMPIHPGCDCGEMPIWGTQDPGQVIDEIRLDKTYESIEQQLRLSPDFGARDAGLGKVIKSPTEGQKLADYTELVVVSDHGEFGPTLRWRDQGFTGPNNL